MFWRVEDAFKQGKLTGRATRQEKQTNSGHNGKPLALKTQAHLLLFCLFYSVVMQSFPQQPPVTPLYRGIPCMFLFFLPQTGFLKADEVIIDKESTFLLMSFRGMCSSRFLGSELPM